MLSLLLSLSLSLALSLSLYLSSSFLLYFCCIFVCDPMGNETRDRRYMLMLMYSQALPIGPTQIILRRSTFVVLCPSDCLHVDLVHKTMQWGISAGNKEQQVWKENRSSQIPIWICQREHSFVVIKCQRCMTDFYIQATLANGVQLGVEGPSHIQSSPP